MYKKPEVKVIEVSKEDIIQTSLNSSDIFETDNPLIIGGNKVNNLASDASAPSGNIFQ